MSEMVSDLIFLSRISYVAVWRHVSLCSADRRSMTVRDKVRRARATDLDGDLRGARQI